MTELILGTAGFVITSVLAFIASTIHKDRVRHQLDHAMLKEGMKMLLKSQILDIYNRAKDKGRLGEHEKDVACDLYDSYKALDGNGYMENIMAKIGDF